MSHDRHHPGVLRRLALLALLAPLACLEPLRAAEAPTAAAPAPPQLRLPLACTLGESCWVANYVDVDASPAARDFRCRERSYDGHDGVDFAIRDLGELARGVAVVASAAGVVRNVRDGMADSAVADDASRARVAGRECGNGVLIDHPGGWQTQYCHLRRASVGVSAGQQVAAGSPIGLVGLSGQTEFPHVHLALRRNGEAIDPFTGLPAKAGCGHAGQPLWQSGLGIGYEQVALYNAGIDTTAPDIAAIRNGQRIEQPLSSLAPALVLWVDMFGVQAGDRLAFRLEAPDGTLVVDAEQTIDRTQARRFGFVGSRRKDAAWAAGVYQGEVTHRRLVEGQLRSTTIRSRVELR